MGLFEESVGSQYGELTVTKLGPRKKMRGSTHPKVFVRCSCGVEKEVWFADLRAGRTKTCGDKSVHAGYTHDRSLAAFNFMYSHSYRARALRKGLVFELSKEQFRKLTQLACHYCGVSPSGEHKMQKSVFVGNGVDRMDNQQGYVVGNVVPCCGTCNHAKHTMSYEQFIGWVERLKGYNMRDPKLYFMEL